MGEVGEADIPRYRPHPIPIAQLGLETDLSFKLRLRERDRKLGSKIDAALKRIGDGTFGICKSCGRQISRQRLEARLVTELCIDCKTRQEKREKEQGR